MSACGVVAATAVFVDVRLSPADYYLASVTQVPPVPLLGVAGILVAALPAFLAPPVPRTSAPSTPATPAPDVPADRTGVAA